MNEIPLFNCSVDEGGRIAVAEALRSGELVADGAIPGLESAIQPRLCGRSVVTMSDATHALSMALHLGGVRRGDEVLVLSFNCLSSTAAIPLIGATPVWVDIDPVSASVDLSDCLKAVTERTRALVVYHVAGYPAQVDGLRRLCDDVGIVLIEDANNSFGAEFNGAPIGSFGDYAVISMYANRQVNAIEGAALICREEADANRARYLRRFGIDVRTFRDRDGEIDALTDIREIGISSPMLNTNATLGMYHLQTFDERLAKVRQNIAYMKDQLGGLTEIDIIKPVMGAVPAYWVWLIRCSRRDRLMRHLWSEGIRCSKLHRPNHFYSGFGVKPRALPGTDRLYSEVLAVPCGWWLAPGDLEQVVDRIRSGCRH